MLQLGFKYSRIILFTMFKNYNFIRDIKLFLNSKKVKTITIKH